MKSLKLFILLFTAWIGAASSLTAADDPNNAPVSLVILYRARPETRVAFRKWLKSDGNSYFASLKKSGTFANYQLLFTTFSQSSTFDAAVILDFDHYTDSAKWKQVEFLRPGGLSSEALKLAEPESTSYAEMIDHAVSPKRDLHKSVFLLTFYELVTDVPKYKKYAEGYVVPQMKGWLNEGALSGYSLFVNYNPLRKPWDALLLLEYSDIAAVGQRDAIKDKVRQQLATSDEAWVGWSKNKGEVRHEVSIVMADALLADAP